MERNKTNEYDADAIGGRAGEPDYEREYQEESPDEPDDDEGDGSAGLANESDFGTE